MIDLFWYVRVSILIAFILIACKQISDVPVLNPDKIREQENNNYYFGFNLESPNDKYVNPTKYDQPLPLINRSATKAEIDWAIKFLKIPTWSHGYSPCDSEKSEVSCYELHRSAKAIENWEKSVKSRTTIGTVFVDTTSGLVSFPDKLSMIYHGLQIAIATNRELVTHRKDFEPIILPNSIRNPDENEKVGFRLPTNHLFGCSDVTQRNPNLYFCGSSWPQVLYTHPVIAPKLREDFGFHAAHFLGNYLFGQSEKPSDDCFYNSPRTVVEGWVFDQDTQKNSLMARPHEYERFLPRCGVKSTATSLVTNEREGNFTLVKNNKIVPMFNDIFVFDHNNQNQAVCALRKVTSANRIIHTFGSRLGFWATAMLGKKGSFVNGIDKVCANLTNSQQGSLWHTYCPYNKKDYLYRANNFFMLCGDNIEDANLYITYLLW